MNRQQFVRTERQLAESRLAAVSGCCMLCTLFAALSPNPGQEIGQDSHKNIYKNAHKLTYSDTRDVYHLEPNQAILFV